MFKKIIIFFLCFILSFSILGTGVGAAVTDSKNNNNAAASPVALKAKSAILVEQSTGRILYEMNSHEKLPEASITKIMTELLVLEALEDGSLKWDEKLSCSEHAASMGGSDIWLKPGEIMSVKDLFKAMAVGSANDAAVVLAEKIGGTEQAFVNMMNEKAAQLGMKDTHFVNCNGLDADGHYTTAYDISIMSRELLKHNEILNYCMIWMDSLRDGKTALYNTNKLIRFYTGANGLKTGSTSKAGYCISASAKRGDMQLIAVIMGSDNSDDRFNSAKALLDYGFTNWNVVVPKINTGKITARVLKGVKNKVEAVPGENKSLLIDKGKEKKVTYKTGVVGDVMAPVEKGQVLGQIYLYVDGNKVGSIPLIAKDPIPKITVFIAFSNLFKAMVSG